MTLMLNTKYLDGHGHEARCLIMEVEFSKVPVWVSINLSPLSVNTYIQQAWPLWFQIIMSLSASDLMGKLSFWERTLQILQAFLNFLQFHP